MRLVWTLPIIMACVIFFLIGIEFGLIELLEYAPRRSLISIIHENVSGFNESRPISVSADTSDRPSSTTVEPDDDDESILTCGYHMCPKSSPGKLNVHVVPHTHDDVGWIKTVDEYYYGSETNIKEAGVRHIIDNVIEALKQDPKKKFIYVETAFLMKWWEEQNETTRQDVKLLVNEGRLEIIGGAWSMNDEATTHYQSIIDQSTWGFRRLKDTLGACARPKIGWQIDPFGHSREQASLFAQFGFDAMFIGRLDHEDKAKRFNDKTTEFIWNASSSLGVKSSLFSVVTYDGYYPPHGFCYDVMCNDEKLVDAHGSPVSHINSKIKSFYKYLQEHARYYRTNNIIINMGGDFFYRDANVWFSNLDVLIEYTNKLYGSTVNIFYSTPSCYIKSVNDAEMSWTVKSDDFFPYSDNSHRFWTGFFTSHPTLKFFERMGNNLLQVVKQLSVSSNIMDSKDLEQFREIMGVMQHHDAVTGTEKQYVAENYAKLLHDSMVKGSKIAAKAISIKMVAPNDDGLTVTPEFDSCLLLNTSSCAITETSNEFIAVVYNPTSQSLSTYIRIPITGKHYDVKNSTGDAIVTQLIPIPEAVRLLPGRVSTATKELIFLAADIPALGYKTFHIIENTRNSVLDDDDSPETSSSMSGKFYRVKVNSKGHVVIQSTKHDFNVVQSFHHYESSWGSGAYIFRPTSSIRDYTYTGKYQIFKGPLVQELHLTVNPYVSQVVRLYDGEEKIEFDWLVGPIPVDDGIGREVVTRYSSNLTSRQTFYTDSNGREMLKRVRDFRPTWNITLQEKVAGNYYPVTTKIFLEDKIKALRLSVLNDRAQGGTSLTDGQLELMLHRRLLRDDELGVDQALREEAYGKGRVARGTHYLLASDLKDLRSTALLERLSATQLALRPRIFFSSVTNTAFNQMQDSYVLQASGLKKKLPPNVQILTLEPWKDGKVLLRLEHLFEVDQADDLSSPVEVDLLNLFADFDIVSIRETTLDGNQWIERSTRLKWNSNDLNAEPSNGFEKVRISDDGIKVLLKPMEIRTFIIGIAKES